MNVKIVIIDDIITIVRINGEFCVVDEDFDLFAKEVLAYSKMGIYRFILNFEQVTFVDSLGIGVIIRLASTAMKMKTNVCVICSNPNVKKVLTISNVYKILHFVETEDEALKYFEETTDFIIK